MADEFMKGLSALIVGGLGWMTLAGWYRTHHFEGRQLTAEITIEEPTVYDQIGFFLMDAFFWFAIIGALTFWVLLPALEEARDAWAARRSE
ncbi:DUF7314 family protein [Halomicrobium salinisoli]|uniref:DUF7314 family protein n=1 Tax=Halomicrobium salinisoli TaxID=2878391 RepID=UPI001CEFECA2|nr:hypothetical protein [Halomicrobium salinisoli]